MSETDSSNSSFDLSVYDDSDDEPSKKKKKMPASRAPQYGTYLLHAKKPIFSAELPFEELNRALKIINTPHKLNRVKHCDLENTQIGSFTHMTNMHYCHLIKRAILKHEWYKIPKLLISYIDHEKAANQNYGFIAKYTMIYLLNDPVAKENKLLTELCKTALSSMNEMEVKSFFKKCISSQHFMRNKGIPRKDS